MTVSPKETLKNIKLKNANKIVFRHLNLNSLRNKFQYLKYVNEIISDSSKCAEIMYNFFIDSVLNLDINRELHTHVSNSADPIISVIQKYKKDPSILKLDERMPIVTFNFQPVSDKDMACMIQSVDSTKA